MSSILPSGLMARYIMPGVWPIRSGWRRPRPRPAGIDEHHRRPREGRSLTL
jgi:hypothetical protein